MILRKLLPHRYRIAILELHGTIGGRLKTNQLIPLIDQVRKSSSFKGAIIDIDSGGGSASASELLYVALSKLADTKPLVCYVRGTCASGAYLAACASHKIVALPSSIIGSIGVISIRPVVTELLKRIGITVHVTKTGKLKDLGAPWKTPTADENQNIKALIEELFTNFINIVSQSRQLSIKSVQNLATGEVFTGQRSKSLGLIDNIGDLDTALQLVANKANIAIKPVVLKPKSSIRQKIFGQFSQSLAEQITFGIEDQLSQHNYRYFFPERPPN